MLLQLHRSGNMLRGETAFYLRNDAKGIHDSFKRVTSIEFQAAKITTEWEPIPSEDERLMFENPVTKVQGIGIPDPFWTFYS